MVYLIYFINEKIENTWRDNNMCNFNVQVWKVPIAISPAVKVLWEMTDHSQFTLIPVIISNKFIFDNRDQIQQL